VSESAPESGGSGFLGGRIFGIPVWAILLFVVIAGFLFFRSRSGSSGSSGSSSAPAADTSGSGQDTTGDITIDPGTQQIDVSTGGDTGTGNVTSNPPPKPVPNPQPTPKPPPSQPKHVTPVKVPPKPAAPVTVTVAKWTPANTPWNSTLSGIAAHEHTTVANLMKLNPQIKNANLIQAGSKVRIK